MTKRSKIAMGMAAGLVWSVMILWLATGFVRLPVFALIPTILVSFLAPGVVLLLMIARLSQRRFFDDALIDGGPLSGPAEIDQRVLRNTTEQLVLALCIWPASSVVLAEDGSGVIMVLGLSFALTRLLFWVGYHRSPPLRAFGFAAGFYPTVIVLLWVLLTFAFGLG